MKRESKTTAVLRALVSGSETFPVGMTRGEIRRSAGLPSDTEITRPVRDLRKPPYGLHVLCEEVVIPIFDTKDIGRRWRYRIAAVDLPRARKILDSISPATPDGPRQASHSSSESTAPGDPVAVAGSTSSAYDAGAQHFTFGESLS